MPFVQASTEVVVGMGEELWLACGALLPFALQPF